MIIKRRKLVPVVLCHDCKHAHGRFGKYKFCIKRFWFTEPDNYCKYGEENESMDSKR